MAEEPKRPAQETDVEEAMIEATEDTVKVPDQAEAEPANVEGSEAKSQ
jgi:hypothetical protein